MLRKQCVPLLLLTTVMAFSVPVHAADLPPEAAKLFQPMVNKGIAYLETKGQAADGSYSNFVGIGPTALITTALLRHGVSATEPQVAKSLKFIEDNIQPDGGIYEQGSRFKTYETCLGLMVLAEANQKNKYDQAIAKADAYLKEGQWGTGEATEISDPQYGGGGYSKGGRPDLSNTAFLMEALAAAGNDADSEAMQRALVFVSRCQNLETEHNTTKFSALNPDGGFYYSPVGDGSSPAGTTPNGGLRSYGAMTYAGLKSMLYAGVEADDPRVKAATKWITNNYTVKENPGLNTAGLFYYYQLFAKALNATGQETVVDASGETHDWRAELITELARRQNDDGSWVNSNEKWMEGDANLATGFALLTLSYCK